jgi:succinate dehydrogenase/fumarate reductase flavoprotein subunit
MYMSLKELNQKVDFTCDVLVVGYGGAGAVAAMAAHDSGANVLILEKMAQGGGGTFLSSGGILIPTDMEFADYFDAIQMGTTPRDVIDTFVAGAMKIEDYFKEIGGESERWKSQEIGTSYPPLGRPSWPKVPHGKAMVRCHAKADYQKDLDWDKLSYPEKVRAIGLTYGAALWQMLSSKVEQRGI